MRAIFVLALVLAAAAALGGCNSVVFNPPPPNPSYVVDQQVTSYPYQCYRWR